MTCSHSRNSQERFLLTFNSVCTVWTKSAKQQCNRSFHFCQLYLINSKGNRKTFFFVKQLVGNLYHPLLTNVTTS